MGVCDINGVGEDEVTVTSGLHAQAERTNKQTGGRGLHRNFGATRTSRKNKETNRRERATSGGGFDQDPKPREKGGSALERRIHWGRSQRPGTRRRAQVRGRAAARGRERGRPTI